MTKEQFLYELEKKLKHLPADERADAVQFYREYFEEAGAENEQRVIAELKSPAHVASKILAEFAEREMDVGRKAHKKRKRSFGNGILFAMLALCAAPIALPLLSVVVVVVVTVFAVLTALVFASVIVAVALAIVSFIALFAYPVWTFLLLGGAFVSAGVSILLILLIKHFASFIIKKLAR